jgi:hypothetical protein
MDSKAIIPETSRSGRRHLVVRSMHQRCEPCYCRSEHSPAKRLSGHEASRRIFRVDINEAKTENKDPVHVFSFNRPPYHASDQ